mgnify:CR=1 FL=1
MKNMKNMNRKKMTNVKPIVYKIVFMGDSGVGKTSVALRISCNTFVPNGEATIGASYCSKIIYKDDIQYNFNIWDTAGQEKYRCLVPLYYKNSDAAIIVYDITNKRSFENAKKNVLELRKNTELSVILFIGNKCDDAIRREVETKEASEYCEDAGLLYGETSAKLNINIKDLLQNILDKLPLPIIKEDITKLTSPDDTWRQSCCNII